MAGECDGEGVTMLYAHDRERPWPKPESLYYVVGPNSVSNLYFVAPWYNDDNVIRRVKNEHCTKNTTHSETGT